MVQLYIVASQDRAAQVPKAGKARGLVLAENALSRREDRTRPPLPLDRAQRVADALNRAHQEDGRQHWVEPWTAPQDRN
jgi:hypothetical protein